MNGGKTGTLLIRRIRIELGWPKGKVWLAGGIGASWAKHYFGWPRGKDFTKEGSLWTPRIFTTKGRPFLIRI